MANDTAEVNSARARRNYLRLKEQGRCVQCSFKLPPGTIGIRCLPCRKVNHPDRNSTPAGNMKRMALFRRQVTRVIETAPTMNVQEQATDLGVSVDRVYALRNHARREGHEVGKSRGGNTTGKNGHGAGGWSSLEGAQRCPRCSLLGEHVCLAGSALDRRPLEAR